MPRLTNNRVNRLRDQYKQSVVYIFVFCYAILEHFEVESRGMGNPRCEGDGNGRERKSLRGVQHRMCHVWTWQVELSVRLWGGRSSVPSGTGSVWLVPGFSRAAVITRDAPDDWFPCWIQGDVTFQQLDCFIRNICSYTPARFTCRLFLIRI